LDKAIPSKKSCFTEAQIMGVLRQAEGGLVTPELCHEHDHLRLSCSANPSRDFQGCGLSPFRRPLTTFIIKEMTMDDDLVSVFRLPEADEDTVECWVPEIEDPEGF